MVVILLFITRHTAHATFWPMCSGQKNVPSSTQLFFKAAWRNCQRWLKWNRLRIFFTG